MPHKMKFYTILFALLLSSCTSAPPESDEEIIKVAILKETEAYITRNKEDFLNSYVNSGLTMTHHHDLPGLEGITFSANGFDEITNIVEHHWDEGIGINFSLPKKSNWRIYINGNMAWAHYYQETIIEQKTYTSSELRILSKEEDKWKIIYASTDLYDKVLPMAKFFIVPD